MPSVKMAPVNEGFCFASLNMSALGPNGCAYGAFILLSAR